MSKNNKKKQNGGINNIEWLLNIIILLIGYHIIMAIYLNVTKKWEGFGINYKNLVLKYKDDGWPGNIIIFFNVIFRILFKPYNNFK